MKSGSHRRGYTRFRHVAHLLLVVVFLAAALCFSGQALAQGLALDTATEKVLDEYDEPNPHFELDCTECHDEPHAESRLNAHAETIACQTCHIPTYSKERATKIWWDWSTAGDSSREDVSDEFGKHTYVIKKGDMKYGMDLVPEYAWYADGKNEAYIRGEKFDPSKPLVMAAPTATKADKGAKIYPFKVMRGKQIYDSKNNVLIAAHLVGKDGFWKTFDWNQAAEIGMKAAGLPYSGEYGFAQTIMYWRLNHQVSPKEEALKCLDCHGDNGRLAWVKLGYKGDPMGASK
jgi:hypothetical protein